MPYKKISDYGVIGNLYTVALVGLDGSIDWLCLPYIDSPSVFAALLDDRKGGRFSVRPAGALDSTAEYLPDTNILLTTFRTDDGVMRLTDFMPVSANVGDGRGERRELYRLVEALEGRVEVEVTFDPRFDYARADTAIEKIEGGVVARGGEDRVTLSSSNVLEIAGSGASARWVLERGQREWLHMRYGAGVVCGCDIDEAGTALEETADFWRGWLRKSETGRAIDFGHYRPMVERSALVLKLLHYEPTGAIAAAATTSLPEELGGERNWDYRYTWVRDASFTLQALYNLGHLSETEEYIRWVGRLMSERSVEDLRIMYSVRGEEHLPETVLEHLEGYRGSRPVRVGNAASGQRQLDIYGELMDAALKLSDYVGKVDASTWPLLRSICDYVCGHWVERDSGIWEVRGGPYDFLYSKMMCWVALDRGLTIARRYGFPADTKKWERVREEIKADVLRRGWSKKKQSFVQHYDTGALDASNLLMPMMGFIGQEDPRMASTLDATLDELGSDGFLYRYREGDGLGGREGAFLLCTFWLVDNLVALGRLREAEEYLDRLEGVANHLGLFSEEYDPVRKEALGNFPQAFTHIGYINSVTALVRARERLSAEKTREAAEVPEALALGLAGEIVLNGGESDIRVSPSELAVMLKNSMNVLRGAFFDAARGRVAYEKMSRSDAYREYVELSRALQFMDPGELRGHEERIAFWINLYNVLVIHGVVEMGIRDSVMEVRNFFRRVKYRIGDMFFSPDDIEHGILRGNARPPHSLLPAIRGEDPRRELVIEPLEPRIHFALVCASSSCPPIGVYTAGELDRELDIAAATFLNAGGLVLERDRGRASLSRVFKWYGGDFGGTAAERLRFLAPYLYDEEDRQFLLENAGSVKISYQDYDWRLNRY